MSDEASPRPWRLLSGATTNHILAANSQFVCDVYGYSGSTHERDKANAALIVDAVNERDRLRDLVKRMADKLEVHRGIFTASNVWSETGCHETCSLIREARAAIGEESK